MSLHMSLSLKKRWVTCWASTRCWLCTSHKDPSVSSTTQVSHWRKLRFRREAGQDHTELAFGFGLSDSRCSLYHIIPPLETSDSPQQHTCMYTHRWTTLKMKRRNWHTPSSHVREHSLVYSSSICKHSIAPNLSSPAVSFCLFSSKCTTVEEDETLNQTPRQAGDVLTAGGNMLSHWQK